VKIIVDNARGFAMDGDITGEIVIKGIKETQRDELARLRNRHVAKILSYLGETPPYLESAIKKAFTMFADDVAANIINSETQEYSDGRVKP
jgi:hypothetical protein